MEWAWPDLLQSLQGFERPTGSQPNFAIPDGLKAKYCQGRAQQRTRNPNPEPGNPIPIPPREQPDVFHGLNVLYLLTPQLATKS